MRLNALGHDATTPAGLGAHNLPDDVLRALAAVADRVIATENASDFAQVAVCPGVFVLKAWWPSASPATSLADALDRWAKTNPEPGNWPHWLTPEFR